MTTQCCIDGLFLLLDRLDSPINIEADLDTFNVKASEAVMTLQDNDVNIDDAVGYVSITVT